MGIIAWKKGFKPWLWILAGGIPGLIILAFMQSAKVDGINEVTQARRRKAGNLVGAVFSSIAVILAITVTILLITVKDTKVLFNLMYASLGRLPWVIACLVAFAFIIVHWYKSPRASTWAARGVGLILICQLLGSAGTQFVLYAIKHYEMAASEIGLMNGIIGIVLILLNILACAFLIVGIYSDRKTESVIPANSISPEENKTLMA